MAAVSFSCCPAIPHLRTVRGFRDALLVLRCPHVLRRTTATPAAAASQRILTTAATSLPAASSGDMAQPRVCVTGAGGFIGSHIVLELLKCGYAVRGTVRNRTSNNVQHLHDMARAFPAAPGSDLSRLELVEADLLDAASWDAVVTGCEFVVHSASPFKLNVPHHAVEKELLTPALRGTEHVLSAVARQNGAVKRVVLTSSVAAVLGEPSERGVGHVFTEHDWSIDVSPHRNAYQYSKRLAEERAWEMHKSAGPMAPFDLVAINPGLVIGPPLSARSDSASVSIVASILGARLPALPSFAFGLVDVRDVATAHVVALTSPLASGRYLCVADTLYLVQMARLLKRHFPRYPVVTWRVPSWLLYLLSPLLPGLDRKTLDGRLGVAPVYDTSRIRSELGLSFRSAEESLVDMANALIDLGIVRSRF